MWLEFVFFNMYNFINKRISLLSSNMQSFQESVHTYQNALSTHEGHSSIHNITLYGSTIIWFNKTNIARNFLSLIDKHRSHLITVRGRLHAAFSTPGLNSALLTGLKFFTITWKISTPGFKCFLPRRHVSYRLCWRILHFVSCNK